MPRHTGRLATSNRVLPHTERRTVKGSIDEAWADAPSDPDTYEDLDYELQALTVIKLEEDTGGKYMILPGEEDHLHDEEFVIADPGSVCRLDECR